MIWKFVADPTTRVAALKSGEVDAVYDVPAVQWESTGDAGFELHKYMTPGRPQQLTFNTPRVRSRTSACARRSPTRLDREAIVETIGHGVIPYEGNGGVSQTTPGWSEKAANWYSLDLDKAADLLDEAGWTDTDDDGFRVKDGETLDSRAALRRRLDHQRRRRFDPAGRPGAGEAGRLQGRADPGAAGRAVRRRLQPARRARHPRATGRPSRAGILYINWRQGTEEAPNYWNASFYEHPELEAIILEANSHRRPRRAERAVRARRRSTSPTTRSPSACTTGSRRSPCRPKLQGVWQEHAQGGPTFYDAYFVE